MWGTLGEIIEIDAEELAPELLDEWLDPKPASRLMEYLWLTYLDGREPLDDESGSVEDALRFLAIAKFVGGALAVACGQEPLDPWEWAEIPERLIHPFALGYQLANRGIEADFERGFNGNLNALIGDFEDEVVRELGRRMPFSDFFVCVLGARRGVEQFPVSDVNMEEHNIELAVMNPEQGILLDYITESWPREPAKERLH